MLEVDKILEKCGSFGRLQLIIVILTSLLNVILSLHYESEEIIFFVPRHWCADGLASGSAPPNTSSCKPLYSNLTIHSSCHKYKYETYMDFQSFVSETNWICKNGWRMNVGGSLYTVSSLLGTLVLGYMGDKVGRLPALILANLISMSGNFLTIFGTNLFTFCLFRLINGFATDTNYAMMYILLLEYIRPSLRTICLTITVGIFYCLGAISSPWVGLLLGTWRSFLLVSSLPLILVPFFYCIVPESVEWLISRRNYNKAVASLRRVAKINGVQIEDSVYEEFIANCKLVQQNTKIDPNLLDLFRTPRLRRIVLILAFDMAVISYCHFIAIRKLNRNWFSHFVWNSIQYTMILPSWLIALAFQDIIGRKALTSTSLICCCLFISITNIVLLDGASDTNRKLRDFELHVQQHLEYKSYNSANFQIQTNWQVTDLLSNLGQLVPETVVLDACPTAQQKSNVYTEILELHKPQQYRLQLNESCSRIRFCSFAEHEAHYLELELPTLRLIEHSLPHCIQLADILASSSRTLTDILHLYLKLLEDLRPFYESFASIDELCDVLQPYPITTKHNTRVFPLKERVYLKLTIADPFASYASMAVQIIGPTEEVAQLRHVLSDGLGSWDIELDMHKNLLNIFDLCYFPMPADFEQPKKDEDEQQRCNICFVYRLDSGEVPIVSCDNPRCVLKCHAACLKEWFDTLIDGKTFLEVSFGLCPFCKAKLSTSFAALLKN